MTEERPEPVHDDDGATPADNSARRKTRRTSLFPAATLEEALGLAEAIIHAAPAGSIRRLTLLDQLAKSPSSGPTRQWITNSNRYGLTTGNQNAETLALTPLSRKAVDEAESLAARTRARFQLGIEGIEVFKQLYESNLGNRLPLQAVLIDQAKEFGVPDSDLSECIETFTVMQSSLGYFEACLEPRGLSRLTLSLTTTCREKRASPVLVSSTRRPGPWSRRRRRGGRPRLSMATSTTSVFTSPIGAEDSEDRRHADLFMGSLVEPAVRAQSGAR